jgi:hypothetical protein
MSRLAQQTERKAITVLNKVLPYFDRLDHVAMSAADALDTRTALTLIKRVIESNPQRQRTTKK